ncbi:MAG TPA: sigma-70 family RNA polymerase sigma factor [Baekduia sp.]|nr:sigma-70 family RNA polymerase sigma factor [Baekduia sp.]
MSGNREAVGGVTGTVGGRPLSEQQLIDRARGGDTRAYEELVRRHQPLALRTAFTIAGSAADAEEAVQDAFMKAWDALGGFRPGAPFRPWLLAIVANEAKTRRRAARRRRWWTEQAANETLTTRDLSSSTPEIQALEHEQRAVLFAALERLPERDRTALRLRYRHELSEREMAAALNCRPGTVKSRLSRALNRLRDQIGEATLVVLVTVAVAAAAVPPVRAAIGRILGFAGGERVERVERVPQGRRLDLGTAMTLARARERAGFPILLPRRLGMPTGVLVGGDLDGRAVTLVYGDDTALTAIPQASILSVAKQIGAEVQVRWVEVSGSSGLWIARGPRALTIPGAAGTRSTRRAAIPGAGVLLWDRDGIAYRLETRQPLATALTIARSVEE